MLLLCYHVMAVPFSATPNVLCMNMNNSKKKYGHIQVDDSWLIHSVQSMLMLQWNGVYHTAVERFLEVQTRLYVCQVNVLCKKRNTKKHAGFLSVCNLCAVDNTRQLPKR